MIDVFSALGWLGMALVILAYYLLSVKRLKFNSIGYNLLNAFGGAGLVVSTFMTKSWPSMALNVVWIIIAIYSIYRKSKIKIPYKDLT
jgi:predicted ferric reductase